MPQPSGVFGVFATVPFGPGPEDMTSWMLEAMAAASPRGFEKFGVAAACGIQGAKGGGWYRGDLNAVADFKGQRLRSAASPGEIVSRLGATLGRCARRSSISFSSKVDAARCRRRPSMRRWLRKLGLPTTSGLAAALGGARLT